ncbi:hypothetical protein ACHHYP_04784 [Achlya hypogyna]|uniref:Uncharacterized protein n=1 Tax=Achlya hypogyna TaxID=1202772 RepID=A0A1V9YZT6_ACHHY|nr:hypothetical protein ACHHYP_04784 [Achlya hypogyna]
MRSREAPMYEPARRTGHLPSSSSNRVFTSSERDIADPPRSMELLALGGDVSGGSNQVEFLYLPSGEILAKTSAPKGGRPQLITESSPAKLQMPTPSLQPVTMPPPPAASATTNFEISPTSSYASTLYPQALSPTSVAIKTRGKDLRASHLVSPHQQRILELETLLQHEKKRSLDKMRQLLHEQDKTHELQSQLNALENRCHVLEAALERQDVSARELQEANGRLEARIAALLADGEAKAKHIASLQSDLHRDRDAVAFTPHHETADCSSQTDPADLSPALAAVRVWKHTADELCATSDASGRLDELLRDFPDLAAPPLTPEAPAVAMLKRRLHLVDREWRQTHAKYVELKELCARQCVREADLQNFVNEHRLRGQCSLQSPPPDESPGRMKVVVTSKSAVLSKLDAMRVPHDRVSVVPSARLAKKHERIPTPKAPRKQRPAAKSARGPAARPWV